MLLDRFRKAKQAEIAELRSKGIPKAFTGNRPDFCQTLKNSAKRPAIIAEYKRASPSKGRIREDLTVAQVALAYAKNGASAMSILTETQFFDGDIQYLAEAHRTLTEAGLSLPLLRKDFRFDPLQIEATAATPVSALLLIVKLVPEDTLLKQLFERTHELGMTAVVEVTDEDDLERARDLGARCIQVNARDLETLAVDGKKAMNLAATHPPMNHETWIYASGIDVADDLVPIAKAGFAACLVGTTLMRGNPGENLARLSSRRMSC